MCRDSTEAFGELGMWCTGSAMSLIPHYDPEG